MAIKKETTFKKIDKAFDRLIKSLDRDRLDVAVVSGAAEMLEIVKSQCPVKSGQLRDSLYIDSSSRKESKQSGWKQNPKYDSASRTSTWGAPGFRSHLAVDNLYCTIATDVHYAWFVEYGTSHAPAYPFMRPAFDSAARPTADAIFSTVQALAQNAILQALS